MTRMKALWIRFAAVLLPVALLTLACPAPEPDETDSGPIRVGVLAPFNTPPGEGIRAQRVSGRRGLAARRLTHVVNVLHHASRRGCRPWVELGQRIEVDLPLEALQIAIGDPRLNFATGHAGRTRGLHDAEARLSHRQSAPSTMYTHPSEAA